MSFLPWYLTTRSWACIFLKCSLIRPGLFGRQVHSGQWYNLQSQNVFRHLRMSRLFLSFRTDGWLKQLVAGDRLFSKTLKMWSSSFGAVAASYNNSESWRVDFGVFCAAFAKLLWASSRSGLLSGLIMTSLDESWSATTCSDSDVWVDVAKTDAVVVELNSAAWLVRTPEVPVTCGSWRALCSTLGMPDAFVSDMLAADIWISVTWRHGS